MGHARSYITFDIIRRILTGYFGFDVFFVQNVTDIDDKIIRRARQQHLFSQYRDQVLTGSVSLDQVAADVRMQMPVLEKAIAEELNVEKKTMLQRTMTEAVSALADSGSISVDQFLTHTRDVLVQLLDARSMSAEYPNEIFSALPQFYENDYNQDMESLSVLRPNVVTRVSEYVPEIISFIEVIIKNGYAYESCGSVYFDVKQFSSSPKHTYAKLVHEAVGDTSALADGEGDLFCSSVTTSEKRNTADFVLWKKSKAGEPKWSSPWGEGRPGWHIECSVMATEILGQHIDIHSGGCDLRFPHHDNEIAQSEAFFDSGDNWISCFIHSGHLNIDGQKMSKSLKNFTTIKEALKSHSKRQLRLAFLLHHWKDTLNYSADTMAGALSDEKYFSEFFLNAKSAIHETDRRFRKWGSSELKLQQQLLEAQDRVDFALRDNFDTKSSLFALKDLIRSCNNYFKVDSAPHAHLVNDVASFVHRILKIFGVIDADARDLDFEGNTGNAAANADEILRPVLKTMANFRHKVRNEGIAMKNQTILEACDRLRDDDLPELGVRLEDKEGGASVIKLVDRETLLREKEEKKRQEEAKAREKEERRKELEEKDALNRLPVSEWVKRVFPVNKFSQFDDKGVPTHDLDGKELSKAQRKKLLKDCEAQERRFQKLLGAKAQNPKE